MATDSTEIRRKSRFTDANPLPFSQVPTHVSHLDQLSHDGKAQSLSAFESSAIGEKRQRADVPTENSHAYSISELKNAGAVESSHTNARKIGIESQTDMEEGEVLSSRVGTGTHRSENPPAHSQVGTSNSATKGIEDKKQEKLAQWRKRLANRKGASAEGSTVSETSTSNQTSSASALPTVPTEKSQDAPNEPILGASVSFSLSRGLGGKKSVFGRSAPLSSPPSSSAFAFDTAPTVSTQVKPLHRGALVGSVFGDEDAWSVSGQAKKKPAFLFDQEESTALSASSAPSQMDNQSLDVDPLDAFVDMIQSHVEQTPAPEGVKPGVVYFEDIVSQIQDSSPLEEEEKPGSLDATYATSVGTTQSEEPIAEDDEEYRKAFVEAVRSKEFMPPSDEGIVEGESSTRSRDAVPVFAMTDKIDEDEALYASEEWQAKDSSLALLNKKLASKEIKPVDHEKMDYLPFNKALYIESSEIAKLTDEEVQEIRDELEIKIRGKNIPKPLLSWDHTGLSSTMLEVLRAQNFAAPFAIQRQALPLIMSGRDVIGLARTGSGKTLAYLLPLFRQIGDQPPLLEGDGPIGLVLAPSRELVIQIAAEARKFCRALGIRVTGVYGGVSVAEQIADIRRKTEIIVATPGRLIDILSLNAGKLLSFARVTYVVLDEADRLMDSGFEPQISRILSIMRPDRQLVMFSATFPPHVESLARKVLKHAPAEIVVGGRSKASPAIAQWVEVREEEDKFRRLLQLLGEWYERGSVLIFVDTQDHCDNLYMNLYRAGYPCLLLHGGQDQVDRDQAIADFKSGAHTLMVATSVAGRGLDVRNLVLVINYTAPNHLEDYVHRVGRTGRAGQKGTAFTFISPSEAAYAGDLIRALKDAKQSHHIPEELVKLWETHKKNVGEGKARNRISGFTATKGYRFDETEKSQSEAAREREKIAYELAQGIITLDEVIEEEAAKKRAQEESERLEDYAADNSVFTQPEESAAKSEKAETVPQPPPVPEGPEVTAEELEILKTKAEAMRRAYSIGLSSLEDTEAAEKAYTDALTRFESINAAKFASAADAARAAAANIQKKLTASGALAEDAVSLSEELEINEYPQMARWKLMREYVKRIEEYANVSISLRGIYVAPKQPVPPNERKLHLLIQGVDPISIRKAKSECLRVLEEETRKIALSRN